MDWKTGIWMENYRKAGIWMGNYGKAGIWMGNYGKAGISIENNGKLVQCCEIMPNTIVPNRKHRKPDRKLQDNQ